jgi:hypothetical protein
MKKMIGMAVAVLALAAAGVAQSPDIAGDWQGTLEIGGGALRIVLHITKSPDGSLQAILDSPDQAIAGMPVDQITLDGNKLKFFVKASNGTYDGVVKNNGSINGNWAQPNKMPLEFKRATTPIKLEHPPAPPSDIDGTWEGIVVFPNPDQGRQHCTFHIKNTGDGLTATFDDPEQNIKGWPATSVNRKGSSVKIVVAQVGGTYQGKLNKDMTVMSGDWNQGINIPLTLKRAKEAPADSPKPAAPAPPKN